jgi:hypothetical protein
MGNCPNCGIGCPEFETDTHVCCDTDLIPSELERSLAMFFSCSKDNMLCWAGNVYDAELMMQKEKAILYTNAIMDYAYLYTYLTTIYWQMVEDRRTDPCGNDKGALFYYNEYKLDCIVKYFRCMDLDIRPMLASFNLYPFEEYTDGVGRMAIIVPPPPDNCPTNDAIFTIR